MRDGNIISSVLWSALLFIVLVGCGEKKTQEKVPGSTAQNVVLVTIDTLRADHIGAYGYSRNTSPFIDLVAKDGVRFESAYSTSSWTVPSVVSMITSSYPSTHGVIHGIVSGGRIEHQQTIPSTLPTLAEMMKKAGYATYGIAANRHLRAEFGFGRGFDQYECLGFSEADKLVEMLGSWKKQLSVDRPFFLWVHFFDPHAPYKPRQPYLDEYWGGRRHFKDLIGVKSGKKHNELNLSFGGERIEFINALYDSEIRYTDSMVERIFKMLPGGRETTIIVSSDHGEEFLDHGRVGHGQTLYNETVRIPLVIKFPKKKYAGTVVSDPVSLIDLMPTIMDQVGADLPSELQGISLLSLLSGKGKGRRDIFSSLSRGRELRGLVAEEWKYIYDLRKPNQSRLFNLGADPGEQKNVLRDENSKVDELKNRIVDRLISLKRTGHHPGSEEISDDHLEQLRALGYLE